MTRRPWLARKWKICGLLFLATTLNYLDRQTLSILAPILREDMHLDNERLGWLFAVFYCAYTLSHFGVGPILDRSHLRWAFGIAVLAWSTVSMLTAFAVGFASLMVFRLLLGVVESANWPAAIRIIAPTMEPRERTLGNGHLMQFFVDQRSELRQAEESPPTPSLKKRQACPPFGIT